MSAILVATDPNWFYSTMAQSTAAIVGLVGAFLIQRILTLRSDLVAPRSSLRREALELWRTIENERRAAEASFAVLGPIKQTLYVASATGKSSVDVKPDADVVMPDGPNGSSLFMQGGTSQNVDVALALDVIGPALTALDHFRDAIPVKSAYLESLDPIRPPRDVLPNPPSSCPMGWDGLLRVPQFLNDRQGELSEETYALKEAHVDFRSRLNLQSFNVLLGILGALLVTCVIVPMFYLNSRSSFGQVLFLIFFSAGTVGLLGYYRYELTRLAETSDLNKPHM